MRLTLAFLLASQPALADSLVATKTIKAQTVIGPADVALVVEDLPGALRDPAHAIGKETRVTIYAGRPVRQVELGPPTLIERNEVVSLVFISGGLAIATEGRALGRGAEGDIIQIMNLASRATVFGRVGRDGAVYVGGNE